MFCVKCGNKLSDGDLFCAKCGNAVKGGIEQVEPSPITGNQPVVRDHTPTEINCEEEPCDEDIRKLSDEELIKIVKIIRRIAISVSVIASIIMVYLIHADLLKNPSTRSLHKASVCFMVAGWILVSILSFFRILAHAVKLRRFPSFWGSWGFLGICGIFGFGYQFFAIWTIVLVLVLGFIGLLSHAAIFEGSQYRELRRRMGLISKEEEAEEKLE